MVSQTKHCHDWPVNGRCLPGAINSKHREAKNPNYLCTDKWPPTLLWWKLCCRLLRILGTFRNTCTSVVPLSPFRSFVLTLMRQKRWNVPFRVTNPIRKTVTSTRHPFTHKFIRGFLGKSFIGIFLDLPRTTSDLGKTKDKSPSTDQL